MIKLAIVEDGELSRKEVVQIISDEYQDIVITEYEQGTDFLKALPQNRYDIYILDIELGEETVNGYDLAKKIRELDTSAVIMFLSSYTEYACDAFEVDALRFLKKPLQEEKVKEAIDKAICILKRNEETVLIKLNGLKKKIKVKDILYLESSLRKVRIKMLDGTQYVEYSTMEEMEQRLNRKVFVRIHKSYIVSMYYIHGMVAQKILLSNGQSLPIGRKYKETFKKSYCNYMNIW